MRLPAVQSSQVQQLPLFCCHETSGDVVSITAGPAMVWMYSIILNRTNTTWCRVWTNPTEYLVLVNVVDHFTDKSERCNGQQPLLLMI